MAHLQQELADVKAKLQAFETQVQRKEAQKKTKTAKKTSVLEKEEKTKRTTKTAARGTPKTISKEQEERKNQLKIKKYNDCLTVAEVLMQYPKEIKKPLRWLDAYTGLKRTGTATFEGVKHIAAKIIELNLSNLNLGNEIVKNLPLIPGLQTLNLSSNKIGAEGAKGLVLPARLKRLNLSYNKIGSEGAKGLVLPPGLQSLNLSSNNIGSEGAERTGVTTWTSITKPRWKQYCRRGVEGLVLPPGLQKLELTHNNIGAEGAKGLVLPSDFKR